VEYPPQAYSDPITKYLVFGGNYSQLDKHDNEYGCQDEDKVYLFLPNLGGN
jgi:hypothetical protein